MPRCTSGRSSGRAAPAGPRSGCRLVVNTPPPRKALTRGLATLPGHRPAWLPWSVVSPPAAIRSLSVALHSAGPTGPSSRGRGRRSRAVRAPHFPRPRAGARPARAGSCGWFQGSRVTLRYQVKSARAARQSPRHGRMPGPGSASTPPMTPKSRCIASRSSFGPATSSGRNPSSYGSIPSQSESISPS
jgi:hypothetical protein